MKTPLLRAGQVGQQPHGRHRWHQLVTRERVLVLATMACVLTGCVHTQRVTLVAGRDPDADACFKACEGSPSCARACPGVAVEDGDCQGRSERTCVSDGEVNSAETTMVVVGLGVLAIAGFVALSMSLFTPAI
jgi:hypothetical protein